VSGLFRLRAHRVRSAGLALVGLIVACAPTEAPRPNVILVSMDTLRADRLSYYGRIERQTTPLLDRLAAESVVFTDCLAPSTVTGPSHLSMFTGQLPERHGLLENGAKASPESTLASVLADAGWHTAGFTGGGYLRERYGLAKGFETYRARGGPLAKFKRTFETSMPYALEWLKAQPPDEPFFLFLHGFDPHCPYEPPPDVLRRFARVQPPPFDPAGMCGEKHYLPRLAAGDFGPAEHEHLEDLYDALVAAADESLAPLVNYLRESGLLERSILVFTSDHGEGLGEHGWIGHGRLWDEQARVPLFVRFPEQRWSGTRDAPVSLIDLVPTLCEAVGVPVPAGTQGVSLLPLVRGDGALAPDRMRVVTFADEVSVRFGTRWKASFRRTGGGAADVRLYDLENDPGEEHDLAGTTDGATRAAEILERFEVWRADAAADDARFRSVGERPDLTDEEAAELSGLGYLDGAE
jgi:arylsulfatase A-like enzyme